MLVIQLSERVWWNRRKVKERSRSSCLLLLLRKSRRRPMHKKRRRKLKQMKAKKQRRHAKSVRKEHPKIRECQTCHYRHKNWKTCKSCWKKRWQKRICPFMKMRRTCFVNHLKQVDSSKALTSLRRRSASVKKIRQQISLRTFNHCLIHINSGTTNQCQNLVKQTLSPMMNSTNQLKSRH